LLLEKYGQSHDRPPTPMLNVNYMFKRLKSK